ncbi:RNA polymerase sigma factor SigJ [Paenibacillus sp. 2TAB19]|uniref:RNA polymerase sigma factor SigJ n=1 Tax=Paenibacillus sp. 2TAB19 TaxID=3233003 RepID=UPI003F9BE312
MEQWYGKYKGLLFKLAYQLTGSASDAEDVLQDVFLKIYDVPPEQVEYPKAYLCKMVTNRCKDLQKSAMKKREIYYGEWLPEPFLSSGDEQSIEQVVKDDLLSYAMLVLLERLSPSERAVFVLREALGFEYHEVGELIDKSEQNCRKLLSRARTKMGIAPDEPIHSEETSHKWVANFMGALKKGDLNQIKSMLAQDVVLVSDGGGKVSASYVPVETRELVAQLLLGPLRHASMVKGIAIIEIVQVNGVPALIFGSAEGVHTVAMIHVEGGKAQKLHVVRNPDKLQRFRAFPVFGVS